MGMHSDLTTHIVCGFWGKYVLDSLLEERAVFHLITIIADLQYSLKNTLCRAPTNYSGVCAVTANPLALARKRENIECVAYFSPSHS